MAFYPTKGGGKEENHKKDATDTYFDAAGDLNDLKYANKIMIE